MGDGPLNSPERPPKISDYTLGGISKSRQAATFPSATMRHGPRVVAPPLTIPSAPEELPARICNLLRSRHAD
jgi:hypothetical protein